MRQKVIIIAEVGVNHNGSIELAYKLVDAAKEAGADAVKFQSFKADSLVSKSAVKAEYQTKTTDANETQYDMIKKLELSPGDHHCLINYCRKKEIQFLSSPFDLESIDMLVEFGLDTFKIPSGEITNLPYLQKIGVLKKNVILSSGMANLNEVSDAIHVLVDYGTRKDKITVLHCNTEYPTPFEDVNLNAMLTIKNAFDVKVGYSDHTTGIEVPIAAVALGAEIIEKHVTLDKSMEGPDHKASLEPIEFKRMVDAIRNIEKAMGDGIKKPSPSEIKNIHIARKSIHTKVSIKKGDFISENDLIMKRPGDGISPMRLEEVIGKKAKIDMPACHKINLSDIE